MPGQITFIDTNLLVYHLVQSQHGFGPLSSSLMGRLRSGAELGFISITVIFECIYILKRSFGVSPSEITQSLAEILEFPGVRSDHPEALAEALRLWRNQGPLSFADCFHLALARHLGMTRIYSFDQKMDRYPGVERIEPS